MTDAAALKQTMLALAYTADAADVVIGDDIAANRQAGQIADCVLKNATPLNGQWQTVWGPRVYDFPYISHGHSNNTMLVVQSVSDPNTYVVAIAGTDPKSWSDWLFEDFFVWSTLPWLYGDVPGELKPKISQATAIGLFTLQQIAPVKGTPQAGVGLRDYLHSVVADTSDEITIYVTGHSLGGALAPTVACWLNDTKAQWDEKDQTTISAYAFAGATPGNQDFATWMNSRFQGDRLVRVSNTLDVVPHGWRYDTMMAIRDLYPAPYTFPKILDKLLEHIASKLESIDYQFVGEGDQVQPIEGSLYDISPLPKMQVERFGAQALKQHVDAYPEKLGLPELNAEIQECIGKVLGESG